MGILQRALETYDLHSELAGVYLDKHQPLAPVSHIITAAGIEITLDRTGSFLEARKLDKAEPKIIIPATEDSAGRTSSPTAHPLCDNLSYVSPCIPQRHELYLTLLRDWERSAYTHPLLTAVLRYVEGGTILDDLSREQIIKVDDKGVPDDEKQLIRWRVLGLEGSTGECWRDPALFNAFIAYYADRKTKETQAFCMATGQMIGAAKQHPKGIVPFYGNAKLISANDSSGFTYRGRFTDDAQAATVGYEASQKAHNALRWLIAEQGLYYGGRVFLCWTPEGKRLTNPASAFLAGLQEVFQPSDYKEQLNSALMSFRKENQLTGTEPAIIAAFDAATTGRLAVTYYNEMQVADFMQRLYDWETSCVSVNNQYGVQSPSLVTLVNNAFGTQRVQKDKAYMETDDRLFRQHLQRLLDAKLNGDQCLPLDVVQALTRRASDPQAYERNVNLSIQFSARCAIRNYRQKRFGEEWPMALDSTCTNRSYLFGRLLAIADKVEQDTYDKENQRQTNAMKLQAVYSRRPLYGWRLLEEKLEPYYRRQKPAFERLYRRLIGEIIEKLSAEDASLDQPLEDVYLLGFYHQQQALYTKKDTTAEPAEEDK